MDFCAEKVEHSFSLLANDYFVQSLCANMIFSRMEIFFLVGDSGEDDTATETGYFTA